MGTVPLQLQIILGLNPNTIYNALSVYNSGFNNEHRSICRGRKNNRP
jgi:hypothetical protein